MASVKQLNIECLAIWHACSAFKHVYKVVATNVFNCQTHIYSVCGYWQKRFFLNKNVIYSFDKKLINK